MRNKLLTVFVLSLFFISCKNDSKESSGGIFNKTGVSDSDKNNANQIIKYYNAVIDYDGNASKKIDNFFKRDYETISNLSNSKKSRSTILTWTAYIGIAPKTKVGFGNNQVDLLKPEQLLKKELATKIKPFIQQMTVAYAKSSKLYSDLGKYYKNEDFKDDAWAKGKEFLEGLTAQSNTYFENRKAFFEAYEAAISKADEDILVGHPLKKELILAKNTLKIVDNLYVLFSDKNVSIDAIEDSYKKLENSFKEAKNLDLENLKNQNKDVKFNNFFDEIEELLGKVRKAKRDGEISKRDFEAIKSEYNSVISDYNYFVK